MENISEHWYSAQEKTEEEIMEKYQKIIVHLQKSPEGTVFKIGDHFTWKIKNNYLKVYHDEHLLATFNLSIFLPEAEDTLIFALCAIV